MVPRSPLTAQTIHEIISAVENTHTPTHTCFPCAAHERRLRRARLLCSEAERILSVLSDELTPAERTDERALYARIEHAQYMSADEYLDAAEDIWNFAIQTARAADHRSIAAPAPPPAPPPAPRTGAGPRPSTPHPHTNAHVHFTPPTAAPGIAPHNAHAHQSYTPSAVATGWTPMAGWMPLSTWWHPTLVSAPLVASPAFVLSPGVLLGTAPAATM
ncbi:hypothetical protein B0H21DRAFT_166915 [Amylocystis lapponica]|nr:hypothetical protein B0H21DRAFT_166915 [Amylocystis lapponica]